MQYAARITLSAASPIPTYTGGIWASGIAQLTAGDRVTGWTSGVLLSIGPVGERADVAQHGNYASQESVDVSISANGYAEFLAAGATLENALVEIGTMSGSTFTVRWSGAVANPSWSGVEVALSVEPMGLRRHREIPAQVLTVTTTPTIAEGSEGKPVPIVYGAVERMTPPILESDSLPETGIRIRESSTEYVDSETTCLAIGTFSEGPIPDVVTSASVTLYYSIMIGGDYGTGSSGTWADADLGGSGEPVSDMYIEVVSGTGTGQRRKIEAIFGGLSRTNVVISPPCAYEMATCNLLTAWDTLPDATSSFFVYKIDRLARYAVADQALSAVVSDRDTAIPIATDTTQVGTILVADVSNEFASGEDVLSLEKLENTSTFGRTYLSDGVTTTGTNQSCRGAGVEFVGDAYYRYYEVSCAATVDYKKLQPKKIDDLYLLGSADFSDVMAGNPWPFALAFYKDFTDRVGLFSEPFSPSSALSRVDANAFSPSLASDGVAKNFRSDAYKLPKIAPIPAIKEITIGLISSHFYGVDNYVTFVTINITKTSGSNTLTKNSGAAITGGERVAPARAPGVSLLEVQLSDTDGAYGVKTTYGRFYRSGYWAEIITHTATEIVVGDASAWPNGTYDVTMLVPTSSGPLGYALEREICLAASYGSVSLASTAVSVASGRRFGSPGMSAPSGFADGDPIIQARHAAVDLITRDLDQYGASSLSYSDLPTDQIHMVIPSRVGSADVLGQMCEEFNWIGSHDSVGREHFLPLFREGDDWTVTNAQIISGTFTGLGKTAVEDVITLPMVSRSWTQADGFRLVANVATLSADASAVNTSNIDQYAPGFDSPAQGVEAYGILRAALDQSGISQVGEIDYQWSSDIQSLLIDSGRLRWSALRKDTATFCVSDTHQAAWAILGRRVGITHRRYIKSERHGVIVARYWYPHLAQVQLTVFLDP